jgi:hypothetical protein
VFLPAAYLNANGRSDKAEFLPELVDQKSLVGEMKRRRDVREEDE